jgi:hypothetical protein
MFHVEQWCDLWISHETGKANHRRGERSTWNIQARQAEALREMFHVEQFINGCNRSSFTAAPRPLDTETMFHVEQLGPPSVECFTWNEST